MTVVTGRGSGANFDQCGKLLTMLKEAGAVLGWEVQADNGAYSIQLAPPAEAEPHPPSTSTHGLGPAQAEPHQASPRTTALSPAQAQPLAPSPLTDNLPPNQFPPSAGQVTMSQPALLTSSGVFDIDAWLKENGWDFIEPNH